jgi:hypothetical protein
MTRAIARLFLVAPILLAARAEPAEPRVERPRVTLELSVGGLQQSEYDDDYGTLQRRGPGVYADATFRLGRHWALATDVAWMKLEDPWRGHLDRATTVRLTPSVLVHFGSRSLQPYLGLGFPIGLRESCYAYPRDAPAQCWSETESSVLAIRAGMKYVNFRSGLTIAPEVRIEFLTLRVGVGVGWARIKRS